MAVVVEVLEPRRMLAAGIADVSVTARGTAVYEGGPTTRFFYIRRSDHTAQPLSVFCTVGGKPRQGIDYNPRV